MVLDAAVAKAESCAVRGMVQATGMVNPMAHFDSWCPRRRSYV